MAISRYSRTPLLDLSKQFGTSLTVQTIRSAIKGGSIRYTELIMTDGSRLDTLAGRYLGAGDLWWAIAAASDVGWGLQVPAGTRIRIPNLDDLYKFVG